MATDRSAAHPAAAADGRFSRHGTGGPLWQAWYRLVDSAARGWKSFRTLGQVLRLVRFSLLLGVVGGIVLMLNDQAQDVVRALGEDPDWRIAWLVVAGLASAGVAWWSARVMLYFRFRSAASAPTVFPKLKEHLPRAIGASALVLVALALIRASFSYQGLTGMPSYASPGPALIRAGPERAPETVFRAWLDGLEPAADGRIPVFLVAAEGGGIRAAYWTALVLGELQDRGAAAGQDLARHVFAISGVSSGSLGATTFAALVANRQVQRKEPIEGCAVDPGVEPMTVRGRINLKLIRCISKNAKRRKLIHVNYHSESVRLL